MRAYSFVVRAVRSCPVPSCLASTVVYSRTYSTIHYILHMTGSAYRVLRTIDYSYIMGTSEWWHQHLWMNVSIRHMEDTMKNFTRSLFSRDAVQNLFCQVCCSQKHLERLSTLSKSNQYRRGDDDSNHQHHRTHDDWPSTFHEDTA